MSYRRTGRPGVLLLHILSVLRETRRALRPQASRGARGCLAADGSAVATTAERVDAGRVQMLRCC